MFSLRNLESESYQKQLDQVYKIMLSALKDYARSSVMTGARGNGTPVIGGIQNQDTYAWAPSNSYIQFDFPEASILNDIKFHLWDYDGRVYTYSIDVLSSGEWKNIIHNRQGQGIQYVHFEDVENVKAIRFSGKNTSNEEFHILNDSLSFKYTL